MKRDSNYLKDAMNMKFSAVFALLVVASIFPDIAVAANDASEAGLPFETNLGKLLTSMTGPIPMILSVVGIVGCGGMLIFGGEISGFTRTMVFLVLVISIIVQARAIVKALGGTDFNTSLITWPMV